MEEAESRPFRYWQGIVVQGPRLLHLERSLATFYGRPKAGSGAQVPCCSADRQPTTVVTDNMTEVQGLEKKLTVARMAQYEKKKRPASLC